MIKKILLPTDGSEQSLAALDPALDLAGRFHADLVTTFVIEPYDAELEPSYVRTLFERDERRAKKTMKKVEQEAEKRGIPVQTEIRRETPAVKALMNAVNEHSADAVVMATHGRSGLNRWILGSTTERVLRNSPVPVLAVPIPRE